MTPETILRDAAQDGVDLTLTKSGSIKLSGSKSAIEKWTPSIRDHKPEILATLNVESRIWHVIYGRWDSHVIYPRPVSAPRVKNDYPEAKLIEPFPKQETEA